MTRHGAGERRILEQVADRQVRRWTLEGEISRRLALEPPPDARPVPLSHYLRPYIALSREAGAGGGEIARLVAERLGWEVLDSELLELMAERYHLPRHMLDVVDETRANWFHEMFAKWVDQHAVTQAEYVVHLGKIVLLAAQHGKVVFVGRGTQFLLPADAGIAVRIVAPRDQRVRRLAEERAVSPAEAERLIDEIDAGRVDFARRTFGKDPRDPHLYDLVVNLARVSRRDAADLIADLHPRRQAD